MTDQKKILIVEDEVFIALQLQFELKRMGYRVEEYVASGEEAVESVRRSRPDLALMDIRLAGDIDGIETVEKIREIASVPVIFMTGYPDDEIKRRAQQTQPAAYFVKPISMPDLFRAIKGVFGE